MKKFGAAGLGILVGLAILFSGCRNARPALPADSDGTGGNAGMESEEESSDTTETSAGTTSGTEAGGVTLSDSRTVTGKTCKCIVKEWHESGNSVPYWTVDVARNGKIIQTLTYRRDDAADFGPFISQLVVEKDANFDGYPDLMIFMGHFGAQGLLRFQCYLWNPDSRKYVYFQEFEEIPNPRLDSANKRIFGTERDNACTHTDFLYQYVGGSLVETRELQEEWQEDGSMKYTEYVRSGHAMKFLREVHVKDYTDAYYEGGYWNIDGDQWQAVEDIRD